MVKKIKAFISNSIEFKNAGWLISGKIIQMLIAFFISIFTTRYLGPSNFGIINYANAYVAFFASICTLGINSVIVKDFLDYPDEHGKTIGTTLVLRTVVSLLSAVMIVSIVGVVDYGDTEIITVSALCSISLIFQVFDTINYWFQSKYLSKVTAIATLIAYIAISVYKIILLILKKNVHWFAAASAVDYIFIAIVLMIAYKKYNGAKLSFSWKKGKELLNKSYHYILSGMMVAIYGHTDRLMLKQMLDEASVGYYSLATTISGMWVFVLAAIIDSMYPSIISSYEVDKKLFERKNRQLYAMVIYISFAVSVLFIIFGGLVIHILYGDKYLPAVEPLKIITWYTAFSYLGVARNAWIVCENNQKYLKYMYFCAAVINIILNYFMIPVWGASGAAVASLITQIFTSLILPSFFKEMRPNVKLMMQAFLLKKLK
ncbi:MAG: flippase [Eubacterium sp.]|nr:flippase [Eubacterium sp.]